MSSTPCDGSPLLFVTVVVRKVSAASDWRVGSGVEEGFHCVLNLRPRSPEVEGQGHCQDDAHEHEERQPGLQEACTADVFSMDESEEAEFDHVPRGAVFISHQIQSHGDV